MKDTLVKRSTFHEDDQMAEDVPMRGLDPESPTLCL